MLRRARRFGASTGVYTFALPRKREYVVMDQDVGEEEHTPLIVLASFFSVPTASSSPALLSQLLQTRATYL